MQNGMVWSVAAGLALAAASIPAPAAPVTFYKDILPILQKRCQSCHRPGEIGPMPLLTYQQARPWAKAMRESVKLRKMPPWFADPRYGEFANDPSLSLAEVHAIDQWASTGAAPGAKADAPPPVHWKAGWNISTPDAVLQMPQPFRVPARSVIDYQYLVFPTGFRQEKWVQAVEIRPSDRSIVHHAVLYVRNPDDVWLRDAPRGRMFAPPESVQTKSDILAVYTPGSGPSEWPEGMAKKIPAGAELVLQVHYTSKETGAQDRTGIGIVFCRTEPDKRVVTLQMGRDQIAIPPGERDYRLSVSGTMPHDALLLSMLPHMHLRGSAFEYEIVEPHGRITTLLAVKPYDFFWQMSYQLKTPRLLRAGERLTWTGHFDNSPNNPRNPDPSAEVHWGEQSWQEMMIGFFDVAIDKYLDKPQFFK